MADIVWTDVTDMFPLDAALAALPGPAQDNILDYVNNGLSPRYFGGKDSGKFKLARIYWAAHLAVAPGVGGAAAAGPVTAKSEGGVSIQYGWSGSSMSGGNGSTSYGRLFDELVRSSPYRAGLST
jgi:hypothetical protein